MYIFLQLYLYDDIRMSICLNFIIENIIIVVFL